MESQRRLSKSGDLEEASTEIRRKVLVYEPAGTTDWTGGRSPPVSPGRLRERRTREAKARRLLKNSFRCQTGI
jgi:hypothetical protein